ncbi:glycosyltransferase family 2 protein [Gammaproteobacteria bacterium]|nr:glycosyltransferase family 2 protein [Gammaproteobacteria bacterium]
MNNSNPFPLVSIYVLNHNYSQYLKFAIDSCLQQSYSNIEILLIDDGSTDESLSIIDSLTLDNNIKVIKQQNLGLIKSCNTAISHTHGKYILRLDADDYLHKDAIKELVQKMEEDEEIVLVFPNYWEVDINNTPIREVQRFNFDTEVTLFNLPSHGAVTLFRRDFLEAIGGYDESFSRQDGYFIWLKAIQDYKVSNVTKPLFYYRQHPVSLSSDKTSLLYTRSQILKKHTSTYPDLNIFSILPVREEKLNGEIFALQPLGSKLLIDWAIESSLDSSSIHKTIVSTESKSIIEYLKKNYDDEIIIHKRKLENAFNNVGLQNTIDEVLNERLELADYDYFLLHSIDYPLLASHFFDAAVSLAKIFHSNSIVSTIDDESVFYKHDGKGIFPLEKDELRVERDILYRKSGGVNLRLLSDYINNKKLLTNQTANLDIDQSSSLKVNSQLTLELANLYIKKFNENK